MLSTRLDTHDEGTDPPLLHTTLRRGGEGEGVRGGWEREFSAGLCL
jgi:hypothetical protein